MQTMGGPDLVETLGDGGAGGLELTNQTQDRRQGGDAVLVGYVGGIAAVADGFLVTEDESRHTADPLEPGQGHLVLTLGRPGHSSQTG